MARCVVRAAVPLSYVADPLASSALPTASSSGGLLSITWEGSLLRGTTRTTEKLTVKHNATVEE